MEGEKEDRVGMEGEESEDEKERVRIKGGGGVRMGK